MKYKIKFDFDNTGNAPAVFIVRDDTKVIEVIEEPFCMVGEWWSSNPENWEPGPLARNVLFLMNEYA